MSNIVPNTGSLSMDLLRTIFGASGTTSLSDFYLNGVYVYAYPAEMGSGNSGCPTSGTISFNSLRGAETLNVNFSAYASSSTFVVPANVTKLYVLVSAGGGGGGAGNRSGGDNRVNRTGGTGGPGGLSIGTLTVTPDQSITVTVGSGGTSSTSGGTAGGSSSFLTLSATGGKAGANATTANHGAAGAAGTGSGGSFSNSNVSTTSWTLIDLWNLSLTSNATAMETIANQTYSARSGGTAAVAWSSAGATRSGRPGIGGTGLDAAGNGGVGGGIVVMY